MDNKQRISIGKYPIALTRSPWGLPEVHVRPAGRNELPRWFSTHAGPECIGIVLAPGQVRWLIDALSVAEPDDAAPRAALIPAMPLSGALAPYLAFKSLVGAAEAPFLVSPSRPWPWAYQHVDGLGFCHAAHADCVPREGGVGGIYAATAREAMHYGGALYLVAPLPGATAVVGESGWRASAAYVAAGPLDTPQRVLEAAATIVAAAAAGMPQCDDILAEARRMVGEDQALAMLMPAAPLTANTANEHASRATDDLDEVARCIAENDLAPLAHLIYQRRWADVTALPLKRSEKKALCWRIIAALKNATGVIQAGADARGVLAMMLDSGISPQLRTAPVFVQAALTAAADGDAVTAIALLRIASKDIAVPPLDVRSAALAATPYLPERVARKIEEACHGI